MDTLKLSAQQLREAADLQERIEALQTQLGSLLGGAEKPAAPAAKSKGKISAAGRARLAALARARWAKAKQQGKTSL